MLYVVHGDDGAGSCCMFYMGMVVLDDVVCAVVCCAWGHNEVSCHVLP